MKFANMPADKLSLAEVARLAERFGRIQRSNQSMTEAVYRNRALLALLPVVEAAQAWRNESTDATEPLTRLQRGIVDSLAALDKEFPNE